MTGNIIGEPIDGYVQQQIALRQFSQFSGYEYSRTSPELQYLTNRNAWIKLASSVEITNAGLKKLTNINIENANNFLGTGLAKKAILFNTLSEYTNSTSPLTSKRANVTNVYVDGIAGNTLWNDSFAYGIGGKDFGLQPPPGIIGVTVDSLNRGSIRKANINLKAHNRFQFDILELLYLRLGFTMMLEWGWDKYLSLEEGIVSLGDVNNTIIEEKWFESTGYSQISMLNLIQSYRVKYSGNYDGFFGKVSNFTWNYNSDGTYDIAIDLITIGDVIESLKVNASSKIVASTTGSVESTTEPQEAANNITQASYLNTVGYFLYRKAIEVGTAEIGGSEFRAKENTNLALVLGKNYLAINPSKQVGERTNAKGNQSIQFYIRLKEFFAQLESLVIPRIDNNLQLKFELESCLMTHFPNQISFDPKICVFKYPMGYGDIPVAQGEGTEGILNPASIDARNKPNYLSNLADYQVKKGDYIYGDLMNIYVNFEYISGLLLQNGGPDQDLFLFKFLQDLCNGINNALGGVNKLEPIIKDDYIITIIDQTFSSAADNSVNLNVYGYDTDTKTSNFVKDIKFTSKITPGLASTITIGATAGGSSTSEIDGTAFSKWSEGLVDRFSRTVSEPTGVKTLEIQNAVENEELREQRYELEWETDFYDANTTVKSTYADIRLAVNTFFGTENRTDNFFGTSAVEFKNEVTEQDRASGFVKRKLVPPGSKYGGLIGKEGGVSLEEFKIFARAQEEDEKRRNILQVEELQDLVCTDYYFYLINAFGGKSNNYNIPYPNTSNRGKTIPIPYEKSSGNARYLEYNDTFISQGKAAYKNYLNMLNNSRYGETNIPSSEIGFIPLSFDITLDGISGVKIYNKLNINNNFLPSNYPESLKFVITKVNHSISNTGWETSLSTISIPKTSEYKFGEFVTIPTLTNTGGSGGGGDFDPGTLFTSNGSTTNAWKLISDPSIPVENGFLHRYPGMLVEADNNLYERLNMVNDSDNKKFRLFYAAMPHFINLLDAYEKAVSENGQTFLQRYGKLTITSAYRAIQVTPVGNKAAAAGSSKHGLGLAIDLQQPASHNEVHEWFKANAPNLGWMRLPIFTRGGETINETWHWELQYDGPYAKIDKNALSITSNIKNNGKNGAPQYKGSNFRNAKGVGDLNSAYIIDQSNPSQDGTRNIWGAQINAQTLPEL
jgi:hypothetical protein